jgi:hypothetical protein
MRVSRLSPYFQGRLTFMLRLLQPTSNEGDTECYDDLRNAFGCVRLPGFLNILFSDKCCCCCCCCWATYIAHDGFSEASMFVNRSLQKWKWSRLNPKIAYAINCYFSITSRYWELAIRKKVATYWLKFFCPHKQDRKSYNHINTLIALTRLLIILSHKISVNVRFCLKNTISIVTTLLSFCADF